VIFGGRCAGSVHERVGDLEGLGHADLPGRRMLPQVSFYVSL
jgi:hypothetical protein